MSDLAAFEPVWEDMRKTRAHLADVLRAMQSAGLIGEPAPEPPPHKQSGIGQALAEAYGDGKAKLGARIWLAPGARAAATSLRCSHPDAVPVDLVLTGEIVAALCPDCDEQLPATFRSGVQSWPGAMF